VAETTADLLTLAQRHTDIFAFSTWAERAAFAFLDNKVACRLDDRQYSTLPLAAVAGSAAVGVVLGEIFVTTIGETPASDRMHTMWSTEGNTQRPRFVTSITLYNRPAMPLQLAGGDIVIGIRIGVRPDGVGATVATLAEDAVMSFATAIVVATQTEQTLILRKPRSW